MDNKEMMNQCRRRDQHYADGRRFVFGGTEFDVLSSEFARRGRDFPHLQQY